MDSNRFENAVRVSLCSLSLFVNHGIRDYIITAIPTISASKEQLDSTRQFEDIFLDGRDVISLDELNRQRSNCSSKHFTSYGFFKNSYTCFKQGELNTDEWSNGSIGLVLASSHLTCIIGLLMAFNLAPRILSGRWLLGINLFCTGAVALFSELAGNRGPSDLIALRAVQGLFQGFCYPAVYQNLRELPNDKSCWILFIFAWSWFGSALGMIMGTGEHPFLAPYVFGSISVLLFLPIILLKKISKDDQEFSRSWREILYCKAVWSCLFIQFSTVWTLYTVAIGISLTATYFMEGIEDFNKVGWCLLSLYMASSLLNLILFVSAEILMTKHIFSGLNKIRVFTGSGCLFIVLGLSLCGSIGLNSLSTMLGVSVIVLTGVALSFVGVRWNLHELAPIDSSPVLVMSCIAGSMGAAVASILFPVIAEIDSAKVNRDTWNTAWLITIVPVVLTVAAHMFLVSVRTLPYQSIIVTKVTETDVNSAIPTGEGVDYQPAGVAPTDTKSFKSFKSVATFKTAVSRFRTRTVTFNTVNEDIEADLQSAIDGDELKSVGADSEEEMHSVKSGATSYCSNLDEQMKSAKEFGVILSAEDLDRTSAWLSTHHSVDGSRLNRRNTRIDPNAKVIFIQIQW